MKHIKLFEQFINEAKMLSFKDAGITDMMDLSKAMDVLRDSKIDWNQKGQAFVFVSSKEHASAIKALGLDESVVAEGLRSDLKKYIKSNQKHLDNFADNEDWNSLYTMLLTDFGVEDHESSEADELKTNFNMVY
jgi:hypothetical protein